MRDPVRALRDSIMRRALVQPEEKAVLRFIRACGLDGEGVVLDVGCGFGDRLASLVLAGRDVHGVDVNPATVSAVRARGLVCFTEEEFRSTDRIYDAVLMSHIIEHFSGDRIIAFLDPYLDRLKRGGHLVVATPTMTGRFFEDPDHVRPYSPGSLLMLFGQGQHQVRSMAGNRLRLVDLWYRRQPISLTHARGLSLGGGASAPALANLALALLHLGTFRLLGRVTGWVGMFEKL